MKFEILIALSFLSMSCFGQDSFVPPGYKIIEEKMGDLDRDGISERVIVYDTNDTTEDGIVRELQVLKKSNETWTVWKKSRNAVLKSQEGGMAGDPFEGIEIEKGILTVSLSGGSSWKWSYKDKYRFQNGNLELIGYSNTFGKACEYWEDIDFNLSTGKIIYKKEFEDCDKGQEIYKTENETFYKKGISIDLSNRNSKKLKIISPKYKHELYL